MSTRLPPQPVGDDWKTWALQLVEYINNENNQISGVSPQSIQLQHQGFPVTEKAITEGLLMYDPVPQAVVVSKNKVWNPLAPADEAMTWKGDWPGVPTLYKKSDVVRDYPWVMVAIADTLERPAPLPDGPPTTDLPDAPGFNNQTFTGLVLAGHDYTIIEYGEFRGLDIWIPVVDPTVTYDVYITNITDPGNPIVELLPLPVLVANQWNTISLSPVNALIGQKFAVRLRAISSGSATTTNGVWIRHDNSQSTPPSSGGWNRDNQFNTVRMNHADRFAVNRQPLLESVVPGSTITMIDQNNTNASIEFDILSVTLEASSVTYGVSVAQTGPSGEPGINTIDDVIFVVPAAQPTEYVELPNHWSGPGSWGLTEGILELDGVPQAVLNNAYGIRVTFQAYNTPNDWQILGVL